MAKIIAGSTGKQLISLISKDLEIAEIGISIEKFPDHELRVELANAVNDDIIIVQSTSKPTNDNLMELLLIVDAVKRAGAKKIIAVVPYFGYSRQNRQTHPYGTISAQLVANIIEASGIDHLFTIDLHALNIQSYFKNSITNIETTDIFANLLKEKNNIVIASPDAGGSERVLNLSHALGVNFVTINKTRKNDTCEMGNITGNVQGLHCILLDDIVDTGTTLCLAAEILMQNGALSVEAIATHAVLSGNAEEKIMNSVIKQITIANSIEHLQLEAKFKTVDVAPLIAENLKKILSNLE